MLKEVLQVERPPPGFIPKFLFLSMPDDHESGAQLERLINGGIDIDEIKDDKWIPFPVAIVSSLLQDDISSSHLSANLTAQRPKS